MLCVDFCDQSVLIPDDAVMFRNSNAVIATVLTFSSSVLDGNVHLDF